VWRCWRGERLPARTVGCRSRRHRVYGRGRCSTAAFAITARRRSSSCKSMWSTPRRATRSWSRESPRPGSGPANRLP
jgi:hypothetical protein